MTEFLNKTEANVYFVGMSPLASHIKKMSRSTLAKVFPSKRFVLYEKRGKDIVIHSCFKTVVISMDKSGLYAILKDYDDESVVRIGYIPVPITAKDGRAVFVSIPSVCQVERTLRRSKVEKDLIMESTAIAFVVRQNQDPEDIPQPDGELIFAGYEEFKRYTRRTITKMEW